MFRTTLLKKRSVVFSPASSSLPVFREELHGDVKPRFMNGHAVPMEPLIHKATLADMPFIIALAKEKYPARQIEHGISWMEWCIANPERLVLVGPNSAGVAQVNWKYGFERRARLDMLGARPTAGAALEALKIVRLMVAWAKEQGAQDTFVLDADTGVDFEPFSRRLGGKAVTVTRYEIPL
jgi:hypothetical protein